MWKEIALNTTAIDHTSVQPDEVRVFGEQFGPARASPAWPSSLLKSWDSKWLYQFWHPVTAIQSAQQNGNPVVVPDPGWYPLGSQAANTRGPNFTPPFPSYVSGHTATGGALFQTLRHSYSETRLLPLPPTIGTA